MGSGKYLMLSLLSVFCFWGCAAQTWNNPLVRADEVKDIFESATVVPDHTYYYTGPQAQPDAIIAIHDKYILQNLEKTWVRVDISEKMLRDWNRVISNETRIKHPYRGSRIMTPDGNPAGLWYSVQTNTVAKFPSANAIVVYPPSPRLEEKIRAPFRINK